MCLSFIQPYFHFAKNVTIAKDRILMTELMHEWDRCVASYISEKYQSNLWLKLPIETWNFLIRNNSLFSFKFNIIIIMKYTFKTVFEDVNYMLLIYV